MQWNATRCDGLQWFALGWDEVGWDAVGWDVGQGRTPVPRADASGRSLDSGSGCGAAMLRSAPRRHQVAAEERTRPRSEPAAAPQLRWGPAVSPRGFNPWATLGAAVRSHRGTRMWWRAQAVQTHAHNRRTCPRVRCLLTGTVKACTKPRVRPHAHGLWVMRSGRTAAQPSTRIPTGFFWGNWLPGRDQ